MKPLRRIGLPKQPASAAADPQTGVKIDADILLLLQRAEERSRRYQLVLFNDDHHAMDTVVLQIMKAIRCNLARASRIMLEAHQKGQAIVLEGPKDDCQHAQRILEQIELLTDLLAVD